MSTTIADPTVGAPAVEDLSGWGRRIDDAAARLKGVAHRTPVLTSRQLDRRAGSETRIHLKCECFQRAGAFKFRGAWNAVSSLDEAAAARGVVTHSSGNHGQALALAAAERGIPATVVMPEGSSRVKIDAVRGYGGEVRFCAPTQEAREHAALEVVRETGGELVPPFDDARIVAGQATAARELLEEVPDLDLVLVPVGGGGLAAGTALAAALHRSPVRVIGAEPAGADDAARSLAAGRRLPQERVRTLADGLRTGIGQLPFAVLRRWAETIVTVPDADTVEAMRWVWERLKIVIEPSAAVPVAALLGGRIPGGARRVGIVLSGGNVDLQRLPWLAADD